MTRAWAWLTGTSIAAERAMREAAISAAPGCPEAIIRDANRRYADQLRAIRAAIGAMTAPAAEFLRKLERMRGDL